MCGRYSLFATDRLYEHFAVTNDHTPLAPRYNIAPGHNTPVITNNGSNYLQLMHWGLLPSWAKHKTTARPLINARAETIAIKPTFRTLLTKSRCLIPANGYFEWQRHQSHKHPFFFHLPDTPLFAFAGLYSTSDNQNDSHQKFSFTIITTASPDRFLSIHPRVPVILKPDDESVWLDPDNVEPDHLTELLTKLPTSNLQAHPVSSLVNSPANDFPDVIKPVVSHTP